MSNISVRAAQELASRAMKTEKREFKQKISDKHTLQTLAFGGAQTLASPAVGYLVGRLDSKDGVLGDGYRVLGFPVVGLAGAVIAAGGAYMGGVGGAALAGLGKAAVDGELFMYGLKRGYEAAAKTASESA